MNKEIEETVNINRNPSGIVGFWQFMASRTGLFLTCTVVFPSVGLALIVFWIHALHDWNGFVANTGTFLMWVYILLIAGAVSILAWLAYKIAHAILESIGKAADIRQKSALAQLATNRTRVLAESPAGWLVMQQDGTIEAVAIEQKKEV